jgi:hypothetical protein
MFFTMYFTLPSVMSFIRPIIALGCLPLAFSVQAEDAPVPASPWEHSFEIYAQAVNIGGNAKVGNLSANVDVDPEFVMDHLDMAGMFRFESVHQNGWGYLLDYGFMELSGGKDGVFENGGGLLKANLELRQGVFETKGFKRVNSGTATLDYMFGFRWWDNDVRATLDWQNGTRVVDKKIKEDWVDYVVGIRLMDDLSDDWRFHFTTDIGLGANTDFTTLMHVGALYHINDWSDLNVSYRSVWVDYHNTGTFEYTAATQGFMLGWVARF